MIKYKKRDIFKGNEDVIIHGCNCFHTMEAGIAAAIKEKYPGAYLADCESIKGANKLGFYTSYYHKKDDITIVNAYTQYYPGANFQLSAFETVMKRIKTNFYYRYTLSMPKIGAGIGGGNWDQIEQVLINIFTDKDISIYVL